MEGLASATIWSMILEAQYSLSWNRPLSRHVSFFQVCKENVFGAVVWAETVEIPEPRSARMAACRIGAIAALTADTR